MLLVSTLPHQASRLSLTSPLLLHHKHLFRRASRLPTRRTKQMEPANSSAVDSHGVAVTASASTTPTAGRGYQSQRSLQFGRTHVIEPRGKHEATVVWLHGLGDNGAGWTQILETLPLQNIRWIVPTAPVQPVAVFGGLPTTAWFDVGLLSEDATDDLEGLDSSAAHVADLVSSEPPSIKLAIGGFSQGAATALYTLARSVTGELSNGVRFPLKFIAAVAISGWLPCAKNLKNHLERDAHTQKQVEKLPLLLCHGTADEIVLYKYGEKSAAALQSAGFNSLTFKTYKGLGHYTSPEEMNDICTFLRSSLNLES